MLITANKMAKGLCIFCDMPYERGHKCDKKTIQLFLVEVPREDEEEIGIKKSSTLLENYNLT